jgi:hypothetical protein
MIWRYVSFFVGMMALLMSFSACYGIYFYLKYLAPYSELSLTQVTWQNNISISITAIILLLTTIGFILLDIGDSLRESGKR